MAAGRNEGVDAGDVVRALRRRRRLSQRELAGRAGLSASTVDRIEAGRSSPRFDVLARLLAACGCTVVVVDARGRVVPIRGRREEYRLRDGRIMPAHALAIRTVGEGDGWWGWRRIAWELRDPVVPEIGYQLSLGWRRGRATRTWLAVYGQVPWEDAT